MQAIGLRFRDEPGLEFEIVANTDAICAPCPHRDGSDCGKDGQADRRVRETDRRVLEKTGLNVGHLQNARALTGLVNDRLKTRSDVQDICGACPWRGTCLWYVSRAP